MRRLIFLRRPRNAQNEIDGKLKMHSKTPTPKRERKRKREGEEVKESANVKGSSRGHGKGQDGDVDEQHSKATRQHLQRRAIKANEELRGGVSSPQKQNLPGNTIYHLNNNVPQMTSKTGEGRGAKGQQGAGTKGRA